MAFSIPCLFHLKTYICFTFANEKRRKWMFRLKIGYTVLWAKNTIITALDICFHYCVFYECSLFDVNAFFCLITIHYLKCYSIYIHCKNIFVEVMWYPHQLLCCLDIEKLLSHNYTGKIVNDCIASTKYSQKYESISHSFWEIAI